MKKNSIRLIILIMSIGFLSTAQDINREKIRRYKAVVSNSQTYLFGEGFDEDPSTADNKALYNLTSQIDISVQSKFDQISSFGKGQEFKEQIRSVVSTYSGTTLKQAERIQIETPKGFKVLRYLKRSDLNKIFEARSHKIYDFINNAETYLEEAKIADALRYYYWALLLLYSHPESATMTYNNTKLDVYLPKMIKDIMSDVKVILSDNRTVGQEQIISVKFLYKGLPVHNIQYRYEDELGYTDPIDANDGKGILSYKLTKVGKKIAKIAVEYQFEHEKIDLEVTQVMNSSVKRPRFFKHSRKLLNIEGERDKVLSHNSVTEKSTDLSVNKKLVTNKIPIKPCKQKLKMVLQLISKKAYDKIGDYCSIEGKEMVTKLLKYGNVTLLPYGKLTTIQKKNRLQIRSIPMLFSFKNSVKKFTENVVFYFDKDQKICDLAFGLGTKTMNEVMSKKTWTVNQKATLVNFIEQYKTAYALKQLDYIEKVFSDDALIIVGKVIKNTKQLDARYRKNNIVKLNKYTKQQFIKHLSNSFKSKEFINLKLEDIDFKRSGRGNDIFGIKVKQFYYSSNYADQGYLFLLVDLRKPINPIVHIRTWQPEKDALGNVYDAGDF